MNANVDKISTGDSIVSNVKANPKLLGVAWVTIEGMHLDSQVRAASALISSCAAPRLMASPRFTQWVRRNRHLLADYAERDVRSRRPAQSYMLFKGIASR